MRTSPSRPGLARVLLSTLVAACSAGCGDAGPAPHQPGRIAGAQALGRVDADLTVDLVLAFAPSTDAPEAEPARARLTPATYGARFGPRPSDYDAVAAWLSGEGLTVTRRTPSRTTLSVSGPARAVEDIFRTELLRWRDPRGEFRAPSARFAWPAELAGKVTAVAGLDDAARLWPRSREIPPGAVPLQTSSLGPVELQQTYEVDLVPERGEGQTVAILGTGPPPAVARDLQGFVDAFTLPTDLTAQYAAVLLGGPFREPPWTTLEFENALDAELVLAVAPKAAIVQVLTATNAAGLFADGIAFVVNNLPQAHAVALSYGTCERNATFEAIVTGALFAQARAQGQQWFVASGDTGTDACRDGATGMLTVDWPAAAADVAAVGGTMLNASSIEVAWNVGGAASGGGQSEFIPKPAWQGGVGPYPSDGARNVPDVAAFAAGLDVFVFGTPSGAGGTSASAPLWAGLWALLDQRMGGQGITNGLERLYQLGPSATGLHDIVEGTNTTTAGAGYSTLPGYDLVTGWGSPRLKALGDAW